MIRELISFCKFKFYRTYFEKINFIVISSMKQPLLLRTTSQLDEVSTLLLFCFSIIRQRYLVVTFVESIFGLAPLRQRQLSAIKLIFCT